MGPDGPRLGLGTVALLLGASAWSVRLGWFSAPYWVLLAWAWPCCGFGGHPYLALGTAGRTLDGRGWRGGWRSCGAWRRGTLTALLDTSGRRAPAAHCSIWPTGPRPADVDRGAAPRRSSRSPRPVRLILFAGFGLLSSLGPPRSPPPARCAVPLPRCGIRSGPGKPRLLRSAYVRPTILVDRGQPAEFTSRRWAVGRDALAPCTRRVLEDHEACDSILWAGRRLHAAPPERPVRPSDQRKPLVRYRRRCACGCRSFSARSTSSPRYPAYLGLESEPLPTGGDTLILPAGTRLETRGEATAQLARRHGSPASRRIAEGDGNQLRRHVRSAPLGRVPAGPRHCQRSAPGGRLRAAAASAWCPTAPPRWRSRCRGPIPWRRSASGTADH